MTMPEGWSIRPVTPDDADAFARCHAEAVALTYAHIMPPEFGDSRLAEIGEAADRLRHQFAVEVLDRAEGRVPHRTHWVGVDDHGAVVAIASVGPGRDPWDLAMGHPDPPISYNLDQIYLLPRAQGTGLAQHLLDVILPNGLGAWLWILRDNPRAEAFYRRNGFVDEPYETTCGDLWFHKPMFRMWRPDAVHTDAVHTNPVPTDAPPPDTEDYDQSQRPVPDAKAGDQK